MAAARNVYNVHRTGRRYVDVHNIPICYLRPIFIGFTCARVSRAAFGKDAIYITDAYNVSHTRDKGGTPLLQR